MKVDDFHQSGQWQLVVPCMMQDVTDEFYTAVVFNLELQRNPNYFVLVILAPNSCLFLLSFSVFFVPFAGGEKVSTGLTIFLAIIVELIVVSDTLPPTGPDDIPIVAQILVVYISLLFLAVSAVVLLTAVYSKQTELPKLWRKFLKLRLIGVLCSSQLAGDPSRATL